MPLKTSFALLVFVVGAAVSQESFYFAESPSDTEVVEGRPATLRCRASRPDAISYYWEAGGARLPNTTRRHQRGPYLHFTRVLRHRDAAEFACIATNTSTGFSLRSRAVSLIIHWLGEQVSVQLQSPSAAADIAPGHDVSLRCKADGSGDLRYAWYRNGERLSKSEHLGIHGHRLHIRNVSVADNGVYRCTAHNKAGSRNSTVNLVLTVPGHNIASILQPPSNLLVKRGDTAVFDCVFENADETEWYLWPHSEAIKNSTRYSVFSNGSLVIYSVNDEHPTDDRGTYSCVGIRGKEKQTYSAELKVAYLQPLTSNSFEPPLPDDGIRVVAERMEFETTCLPPDGDPPPRVWWLDPQEHVVTDTGPVRVDDTRLIIAAARPGKDDGNYSCIAENLAGTSTANLQLIVSTPPTVLASPIPVTVEEGESAIFRCQFEAMPFPVTKVHWLKDGKQLREAEHLKTNLRTGILNITEVFLEDRGQYSCQVNTTGFPPQISKAASLFVKEKLKFNPRPVNKKLELGSESRVYCKAQGSDPPVIKWFKEGENMFELPKHVQDHNGTLVFTRVTMNDKGRYTCVATNTQGIINATINIDVIVTPKFTVLPQNPTRAYEGHSVMIHCIAEGDPKPTIKWDRNSNFSALEQDRFTVLKNGTLWVKEVQLSDEGRYGCTAGNSGGFKREEVVLYVQSGEGYRPMEGSDEDSMMTKTVTITLTAAAAYMVLVIGLMIWCRYRRRKRKQAYMDANGAEGTNTLLTKAENGEAVGEHTELKETGGLCLTGGAGPRSEGDGGDTGHSHSSGHSKRSKNGYDKVSVSRKDLHSLVLLGHCDFGEVFLAKMRGLHLEGDDKVKEKEDKDSVVMIKALQSTRDENLLQEFRRQLDMFHRLQHENVAKLVGLCRDAEPHYMVLEYTDWGDLKQFLLATRGGKDGIRTKSQRPQPPQLSVTQIIQLANQVAQGMEHLADHRLVHRDLAARNCLIASNLTVKVSLPGLCKDTYSKEYCSHHNQMIPLRWMPYEAVFEDDYSTKSDVYAFACLVWEMFHQGELPFPKMSDEAVLTALKKHELQWKPHKAAPQSLQSLLLSCWSESPRDRPTFNQLVVTIGEISIDSEI
ncbi:inactive tyrosine-protein kinase 7-like [Schistocerca gregaria]|uniref:inactive tyrosine-protein kinase 7-like n=1 Tax=Schistocerca gregaria TaxID=7010 RepID=UPI00211EAB9A|nr:inactive tyrosine-protein kinase 7-like [Schistocerca gregaria]